MPFRFDQANTKKSVINTLSRWGQNYLSISSMCNLPICHFNQHWIIIFPAAEQWTVTHWSNPFFSTIIHDIIQSPIRVELNLIDSWSRKPCFLHLLEVMYTKVGDSNRPVILCTKHGYAAFSLA